MRAAFPALAIAVVLASQSSAVPAALTSQDVRDATRLGTTGDPQHERDSFADHDFIIYREGRNELGRDWKRIRVGRALPEEFATWR